MIDAARRGAVAVARAACQSRVAVRSLALVCGAPALLTAQARAPRPARPTPAMVAALRDADALVARAVGQVTAGAVLLVAQHGQVIHARAFGDAERLDATGRPLAHPRPMRVDTRFDLASVTKVMATTLALMTLVDQGRVDLDAPVARYLSEFTGPHLDSITPRLLLRHASGLTPWQPIYYHARTAREALAHIVSLPLASGVGRERRYSDLGFMTLGYLVERVTGEPLDRYLARSVYAPLGLAHTGFVPRGVPRAAFAATEVGNGYEHRMVYDTTFAFPYRGDPRAWDGWRSTVLAGEVNDGNAWYAHGGVARHAGLFSTAADLARLLTLLLNGGTLDGRRLLRAGTVRTFLTPEPFGHYLGWMRPAGLPEGSFMHTGFTGPWVLGMPAHGLAVVLLCNRQQLGARPDGRFADLGPLRDAVGRRIVSGAAAPTSP